MPVPEPSKITEIASEIFSRLPEPQRLDEEARLTAYAGYDAAQHITDDLSPEQIDQLLDDLESEFSKLLRPGDPPAAPAPADDKGGENG